MSIMIAAEVIGLVIDAILKMASSCSVALAPTSRLPAACSNMTPSALVTSTTTAGVSPTETTASGTDAPGPGGTAPGGTAPGGTAPGGTAPGGTAPGGTGDGDGADGGRGWREWSGAADRGRFGGADWESARESVRDIGSSVRRIATQAGDAARDPHVRDSAQRAARSLGDAIVTTVEDFAAELRGRMRNPRWSDTSQPPEPPPVAPIEDKRDDKP